VTSQTAPLAIFFAVIVLVMERRVIRELNVAVLIDSKNVPAECVPVVLGEVRSRGSGCGTCNNRKPQVAKIGIPFVKKAYGGLQPAEEWERACLVHAIEYEGLVNGQESYFILHPVLRSPKFLQERTIAILSSSLMRWIYCTLPKFPTKPS